MYENKMTILKKINIVSSLVISRNNHFTSILLTLMAFARKILVDEN